MTMTLIHDNEDDDKIMNGSDITKEIGMNNVKVVGLALRRDSKR